MIIIIIIVSHTKNQCLGYFIPTIKVKWKHIQTGYRVWIKKMCLVLAYELVSAINNIVIDSNSVYTLWDDTLYRKMWSVLVCYTFSYKFQLRYPKTSIKTIALKLCNTCTLQCVMKLIILLKGIDWNTNNNKYTRSPDYKTNVY